MKTNNHSERKTENKNNNHNIDRKQLFLETFQENKQSMDYLKGR